MLCETLSGLHHATHLQIIGPITRLKLKAFDLQQFWKLFQCSCTAQRQSSDLHASSNLHQIQEHPPYKAIWHPETTVPTTSKPAPQLECLPSELQLMIMTQLGDVKTLQSLTLSSQTFNRLHTRHQKTILPAVLALEIDQSVFEEAYWAVRAAQQGFNSSNFSRKIQDFIAEWDESGTGFPKPRDVPIADLLQISRLHGHVNTLVEDFCTYALSGPMVPSPPHAHPQKISTMEFSRIARAFYRFEFYCNLYKDHPPAEDLTLNTSINFAVRENSHKIFDSWDPWGIEGIACIRDYFCARLTAVFANIQQAAAKDPLQVHIYPPWEDPGIEDEDIPENHIFFCDDLVPSWYDKTAPSGASFLHQGCYTKSLKEGFMSRGLEFLCRLLTANSGYEQYQLFQSIMHDLAFCRGTHFITHALREYPVCMQEEGEAMESYCHGDALDFLGDVHPAAPNFAWTWANGGKFQPFYAEGRMEYLRSLGYVMWDQERLLQIHLFRQEPLQQGNSEVGPPRTTIIAEHEPKCSRRIPEAEENPTDGALLSSQEPQTQIDGEISDDESELSYQIWEDVPLLASSANIESTFDHSNELAQDETVGLSQLRSIVKDDDHAVSSSQDSEDASSNTLATPVELCNPPDDQLGKDRTCALPLTTENLAPASEIIVPPRDLLKEDDVPSPLKDESDPDVGKLSADESTSKAEPIFKQPLERKIARAISPKAKLLKLQQEAAQKNEASPSNLVEEIEPSTSFRTTTISTDIQPAAPSTPSSDCSSSIPESGRSMKSKASSTTSSELSVANHATASPNTHAESNDMLDTATKSTEDNATRLHLSTKDASDVAAWIEGSNSRQPSPTQSTSTGPIPDSSGSSDMSVSSTSTNTNLTKQQRKKANRKARNAEAATETKAENAVQAQQTKETEVEPVSKEEKIEKEFQTEDVEKAITTTKDETITTTKAVEGEEEIMALKSNKGGKMANAKAKKNGKAKGKLKAKKDQKRKTVGYLIG